MFKIKELEKELGIKQNRRRDIQRKLRQSYLMLPYLSPDTPISLKKRSDYIEKVSNRGLYNLEILAKYHR